MTRTENPQLVEAVMVLHYVGKSSYEIAKVLKLRNIILSPSGVQRLIARNSEIVELHLFPKSIGWGIHLTVP